MQKTGWGKASRWYTKIVGESGHYYHRQMVIPAVLRLLSLEDNDSLLDLGCGQGVLSRAIPKENSYFGMDISGALIAEARRLNHNLKHTFVAADVSKPMSNLDQKFDAVAVILALQNIKDYRGVIENIGKSLKPGGKAAIVLNHPCFRIPRQSGWSVDQSEKLQKRWINRYMSPMEIPISMHPGRSSQMTWSFHQPLSAYVAAFTDAGLAVVAMEELVSDKESEGKMGKVENRSRAEIPLFLAIKIIKLSEI